jgi:DNA primase
MVTENTETRTRRYRGISYTSPIEAAKEAVPILDLAERLSGPGVRRGREIAFRCPLHDDHDPSLRVDPEKRVWFCDPCLVGGDVVELARLAWAYDQRDAHVAAAMLLMEFGHEVPQRPPSWFRKQKRQQPVRDAIEQARFEHLRRRLFRKFFKDSVLAIEEEEEREAEYRILWDVTRPLAKMLLADLEEGRSA